MTPEQRERWAALVERMTEQLAIRIGDKDAQEAIRLAAFLRSPECPEDGDVLLKNQGSGQLGTLHIPGFTRINIGGGKEER